MCARRIVFGELGGDEAGDGGELGGGGGGFNVWPEGISVLNGEGEAGGVHGRDSWYAIDNDMVRFCGG